MAGRVVVTGLGAVTPLGNDVSSTWERLLAGQSGIGRITQFDPEPFAVQISGEVRDFDPLLYVERKAARRMDRNVQFAVAAAKQALSDAGLTIDERNRDRTGVVLGTAVGGIKTLLDQQKQLEEKGPNRLSPFFIQNMIPDTASGQVAISCGARGPNMAIVSACATGGHSIGEAAEIIRRGDADVMIAGGTEAGILPVTLAGFIVMRALASGNGDPTKACKPFDLRREGFVLAEGASVLILESEEYALDRGATIYGELVGYGSSNDAYDLAVPSENGEGAARAIAMALRKAKLFPAEVDYINAHGTGTPLNDKFETAAIKQVFGDHAKRLMVSSTKSMLGHMMGAAGAIEGLVCLLAIRDGLAPPTINYETPDPECDLDYVPNFARKAEINVAMSNSLGLGGHNSCVIFRTYNN